MDLQVLRRALALTMMDRLAMEGGGHVDAQAIQQAIEVLRERGEPVSVRRVRKAMIELGYPGGSFRDLSDALHEIGALTLSEGEATDDFSGDSPENSSEDLPAEFAENSGADQPTPPDHNEEEDEEPEPTAAERIAQAEAQLAAAQAHVEACEAQLRTGPQGFPEESEKFCMLEGISFEKPSLAGTLKKRWLHESPGKCPS